jgi:N-acetylglucosamine malate deacetylase 1
MTNVVVSILAHPDDAEFLCAGTLIRLQREHGFEVHVASMTPGDCGSVEHGPEEISRIRRREGAHAVEERDLLICYGEPTIEKVTRLLRQVRPSIVITHSPTDYMLDHEMTSTVVRAAAFGAPIPNFLADRELGPSIEHIPHVYYCDPIEGKDPVGREVPPGFCIDIGKVIDLKAEMLARHASQRAWLMKHHGMDQYIQAMKDWGAHRGKQCGVQYAEGFRQHLGHSYPQDNLLGKWLAALAPK